MQQDPRLQGRAPGFGNTSLFFATNAAEVFPKITSRDIRSHAANISFLCVVIDLPHWSVSGVTSQYLVGPAALSVPRCVICI